MIDGVDMTPDPVRRRARAGATCSSTIAARQLYAARKGPFKAHFITRPAYGADAPETHDPPLLFHLGHDPAERFNVAAAHPDVLADIAREVERHRATVVPVKSQFEETIEGR